MSQNIADLNQHAMSLLASNRLAEARMAFIDICHLTPDDAQAWVTAATISGDLGMKEEARTFLKTAITIESDHEQAYLALALIYNDDADYIQALSLCERALSIDNDYPEAWLVHCAMLGKLGRYDDAVASAERAIELAPDMTDAHVNLGNSLDSLGQHDAAAAAYRQAINLDPSLAKAHISLAGSQASLGLFEDAKATCAQAEQLAPKDPALTFLQARIHEHEGRYQIAFDLLQPLLDNKAFDIGAAVTLANAAMQLDRSAEVAVILEDMLKKGEMLPFNQRHIHMALGHLYDTMKSYDKAFQNFEQGNMLGIDEFDTERNKLIIDHYIEFFSTLRTDTLVKANNNSELPIFIVGMPRSGTTLIEQILSCHQNIEGAGELAEIHKITMALDTEHQGIGYPDCLQIIKSETLTAHADRCIHELRKFSTEALRIVDKMPSNFRHLGLIQQLFPRARIIHCVRDPIDTCLSCYFMAFRGHGYTNNLRHLGMFYQQYERLMAHWKSVLRLPILEVQYEDLVDDTEGMSKKIIEFCGLDWDESCLSFHESKRTVMTASYQQVRRPIYKSSVKRWRHYENHLQPLLQELGLDTATSNS